MDAKVATGMAWGQANSNQPFIWVVRPGSVHGCDWIEFLPEDLVSEMKVKGLIVKWAPQKDVLAHSAVGGFWSHVWLELAMTSGFSRGVNSFCFAKFGYIISGDPRKECAIDVLGVVTWYTGLMLNMKDDFAFGIGNDFLVKLWWSSFNLVGFDNSKVVLWFETDFVGTKVIVHSIVDDVMGFRKTV
ncbi:unnamed protein product [Lactuca virosa]|uniref:Uncharacterized protein n=1 Tax=Lactuca virosa TaxID=75947 RepID=A0AAU9M813_9ASTR|nr:unnamed protein product [Lactuca virosa]